MILNRLSHFLRSRMILLPLIAGLGACAMTINEQSVFAPRALERDASAPALSLRDEARFAAPVEGQPLRLNRRLPATITHETRAFGGLSIALTHAVAERPFPNEPLYVVCGGNASDRFRNGGAYIARTLPYGETLLFDYPGYGDSGGASQIADFEKIQADFAAYIAARADGRPVIFWGHSLGGFICAELAGQMPQASAIVLETTAPNVQEVVKVWKPAVLFFLRTQIQPELAAYDMPATLKDFKGPILVLGGGKDDVLPVILARSLAQQLEAKGRDVTYLEFPEADHYDVSRQADFEHRADPFFSSFIAPD